MDIQKKTHLKQFNIKRFTLTAVASAFLALNAEVARAVSCPAAINNSLLASIICDFDATSSVTVGSGGEVGGINMSSYHPTSGQITIDSGGLISNTSGVGVTIDNSTLSNGFVNNGTILNTDGQGIVISNGSTISGGLSNTNLISTGAGGITIDNSSINGGISNSGTIRSNTFGTGLLINASTVQGGITNTGTIQGSAVDSGISILNNSTIEGGFTNTGLIDAVDGNAFLISGGSTINDGVSNSGTIRSTNQNGMEFNVAHLNNGNILNSGTISGGTNGLSIHNSSSVSGSIINTGTISGGTLGLTIYSATTVGGVSNSGTIRGGQTGIKVYDTTTVSGGISNSGTIQGDINAINIHPGSTVSDINIQGQHARVIGNVEASNTDFNIKSGAIFSSEGAFNVKNFNIESNALFNMANTITAAEGVHNSGTLSVGDNQETITGDYTQNTGGTFQTDISNATTYGQLVSTGAVDLSQSGNINVQLAQNASIHQGQVFSDVINGSSLIGPTNGFHVTDNNSFFWNFIASNNSTNTGVNLTSTVDPAVYNVCQGTYCKGAASTIINQIANGNSAFTPYALLTSSSTFQTAASQATPELTNENIQALQSITRSVMDVVPMWSALHGESAGDAMLYQPGKVWVKPYGGSISQDENNSVPGFNSTLYGVVLGRDIELGKDWLFGGALAAGKDDLRAKSTLNGQSIYSDAYQGILYGTKKLPHHFYLAGQGLVGYDNSDTKRIIPLYSSTAKGSYGGWFTNLRAQLGWNIYATQRLVLTPELDASYLFVNQNAYRESGSTMNLRVNSNSNSSLIFAAYGNGAYRLTSVNDQEEIALTGYAGVARNALNSQPQTIATFTAGGPSFSTQGAQFNGFVFRSGMGLTVASATKPVKLSFNYDLQAGNNAYSGVGSLTVSYKI